MLEYIRLLDGILTIPNLEAVVKAQELFEQGNYSYHEYPIIELFSNKDFEANEMANHVYQIYHTHVDHTLREIGLNFDVSSENAVSLSFLVTMLDAIASLDTLQNQDLIEEAIEFSSGDGAMAISSVLSEMTMYRKMDIYVKFESVNPDLITILQHIADTPDLQFNPIAEIAKIKDDLIAFKEDNDKGPVFDYVETLQVLPVSLDVAMNAVMDALEDFVNAEQQARNLYALTIITDVPKTERKEKAKQIRFDYFPQHTPLIDQYIDDIKEPDDE